MSNGLEKLTNKIQYKFTDNDLLTLALTHRSMGPKNNERLEFLGDALLNVIIADALFQRYQSAKEGELSRLRSSLVSGEALANLSKDFDLGLSLIHI